MRSAQRAASTTFSATSAARLTSPRTSRGKAFSSRSSASAAAATSSAISISVTVSAVAAAKVPSGVALPRTILASTEIGAPIEASSGPASPRFCCACAAKRATRSSSARTGAAGGSEASAARRIAVERASPSTS